MSRTQVRRESTIETTNEHEWAQGFQVNYESGLTEGPLGLSIDAIGLLKVKLVSSRPATVVPL
ncbi:OprD family outer membrane porin [Pseudomonas sp. MPDS]|uniref:OprD family outer membrane porin n=1 Tax=unclassified Pseudomonas TaxID=196821 RepID=UPI00391FB3B0